MSHLGRVVHICNPIILEAEAGAHLAVQDQDGLHNEFQTSLGYKVGLSQINKTQNTPSLSIHNKRTLSGQGQEEAGLVLMDWERSQRTDPWITMNKAV